MLLLPMLNPDHETLRATLLQQEGLHIAFLRARTKPEQIAETLVAFANAQGGTLILGAAPRVGAPPKIEGLDDIAAAREAVLEAMLLCSPPLVLPLPVELIQEEVTLLAVNVPPGLPNVYSLHGKYVRRQDVTNQPLPSDALRRLLNDRGELGWERGVPEDANLDELDGAKIATYLQRIGVPLPENAEFLYRRGCLARIAQEDGTLAYRPTNAGLLLFGQQVDRRFPQAEITLIHYRGRDMDDAFEREDIRDTLPEAVRRAERWLSEHVRKGSRMIGLERLDWVQFPPAALREVLVNAVAHRDYSVRGESIRIAVFSDRLECYSPGRLPGHVTVDNIAQERFSRNETIVQVLADLGLIERLGYGIDRVLRQMEQAGLPPPTFRETTAGFLVALHGQSTEDDGIGDGQIREWMRQGLNERQIAALRYIQENRRITNRDLQELAPDVSAETLRRDLSDLVERGLLLKVGDKRATYYILK